MIMIFLILIVYSIAIQLNHALENIFCSLPSSNELLIQNLPIKFELNIPYTITLSSNDNLFLSYITLNIDSVTTKQNESFCQTKSKSLPSFIHKTEFVLKFEVNSTQTKCLQLKLNSYRNLHDIQIATLCTNSSSTDEITDNDDKYDVQSYMRTINSTEVALQENFNWLIFGSRVRQIWYTHEGMRLSRECDAAEDGRVAIFNNLRGSRTLISHPIDITNVSLVYIRLGSGTCPPPAPTDPPFQLLITADCLNYTDWHVVYSQRILPSSEYVTIPISFKNLTNSSIVCLKIEQNSDKQRNSGSWFIDDLHLIRTRLQNEYFAEIFQTLKPTNWFRLAGGHLKTCAQRMSMVFESNSDIRSEIGATTIDIPLQGSIDYKKDVLFHLSKAISIDWTKWNATGVLDINKTCTDEDAITFNGESFRQLCSPIIELGRIDSVRFTLSTEPCTKRNKYIPTPSAVIFLSVFYNGSTVGYSRTIRRILLNEIKQTYRTYNVRFDELHYDRLANGRICLSQYDHSSGKNVDVWSVRDFLALPLLPSTITHYIQLGLNTKCSSEQIQTANGAVASQSVNIEYSVDFGKNWNLLIQPCFLDSSCSSDVQQIYSSKIILPSSDWHRLILPLPLATLQQKYIRFRISTPPYAQINEPWAIDRVYIGECLRACNGHGWCQFNSCQCDSGYSGRYCEIDNEILFNQASFLLINQTDSLTYQGGRLSYKCNVLSQGKPLVFSKSGFRFLRISNINGSTPKLLEFTFRLGTTNSQCYGTNPTDLDRNLKSILLLTSCSNGIHWKIIDRFHISDILAPDYGTMSRMLFESQPSNSHCFVEWRQMSYGIDNQDVWAIDDITIRDVPSTKQIKRNLHLKTYKSKLTYIRPGFLLYFRLGSSQRKVFHYDDLDIRINSTEIDLSKYGQLFSYSLENYSILTFILILPKQIWFQSIEVQLTTKKFDINFIHLGMPCEQNCWLENLCFDGMCLEEKTSLKKLANLSLNEDDIVKYRINVVDNEILLPFIDSSDITDLHFQTKANVKTKTKLLIECSPNGGVKWFPLDLLINEKTFLTDHHVSIPKICQSKQTLFRWKNTSMHLLNIAFVKSNTQSFLSDLSKWLYPTYSLNSSSLSTRKFRSSSIYQIISTAIKLEQHEYILTIDSSTHQTRLQIDYTWDNQTWHELIDTEQFERPKSRFGQILPSKLQRRTILLRIQSEKPFVLNHIYLGLPCPANCYGHGRCLRKNHESICQCDRNQTSNCLPKNSLLSSLHQTFENKINSSIWTMSSHTQINHRCYNRLSKTTPYLCFLPNNTYSQQAYVIVGPFQAIKYVIFKFGLQYISLTNCSNQILFQYSYDNGIQWFTKRILHETENIFERFDQIKPNTNMYLRWIEDKNSSCLMWNLRSISIRTENDSNIWFDNQSKTEHETWEYFLAQPSSMIQFQLEMSVYEKFPWLLELEISSDEINGWSNWAPLIPPCNQTETYCEDQISTTSSRFWSNLFIKKQNVTIPIPDDYVNQQVRFRWITDEKNVKFTIDKLYIGSDCPWFCSGHGLCHVNGCLCDPGFVQPFCSFNQSISHKTDYLFPWGEKLGYDKCSTQNDREMFSKAGIRTLFTRELSLIGMKYLRIQLDTCLNQTETFLDPIFVQISTNNGIFWETLMTIFYRQNQPDKPWMLDLTKNDLNQLHLVRIRLYQRVETNWTSNWILAKFEFIPQQLPNQWISPDVSAAKTCDYKNRIFPMEIYSTIDIEVNDTSFLSFQLDSHPCLTGSPVTPNRSQFYLEYSVDYGQNWAPIDQPSTLALKTNDIIITQPLRAISNYFYLPLYAYQPLSKFIRIRWLAMNSTLASRWLVKNVRIRSECEILCETNICNSKCRCSNMTNCFTEQTFYERFNHSLEINSDLILLPPLNLISTRFIEFHFHTNCKQTNQQLSLEYSKNSGLTWHLIKFYSLQQKEIYLLHEEFADDLRYDRILLRFIFHSNSVKCLKFEQIIVSGTSTPSDMIYAKFDRMNQFNRNQFLSFGDGIFNGSYLVYHEKTNSTFNEILTDDLNIFGSKFSIQLALMPIQFKRCINIFFFFSLNYGYTWKSIDHDEVLLFDENQSNKIQILTWKFPSNILGSNRARFRIQFDGDPVQLALVEFYLGSNCPNTCHGHGMCLNNSQCRCNAGWTGTDCSQSNRHFPNEIDILQQKYYSAYGISDDKKCGLVFNNTCKREFRTDFIDIDHSYSYVHIEIDDRCMSKPTIRRNGDGWIYVQYREINTHQWTNLHIFKGYEFNVTKLVPKMILQFRMIQRAPILNRTPWSIEQFHIFHIHSSLQWTIEKNHWNSTFLINKNETFYETKDVDFNRNSIIQIESKSLIESIEYSQDFGLTWNEISNENQLKSTSIQFDSYSRLTFTLDLSSTVRFRFQSKFNHLQYVYVGHSCPMNCFGNARCSNGECQMSPLTDFRDIFENNWLLFEPSKHAITRPIDLRPIRAIKWTYEFEPIPKTCQTSIYFLISLDGTLTWSILHQLDLPMKNSSTKLDVTVDLDTNSNQQPSLAQFRWYEIDSSKCSNLTWSLQNIISVKKMNIHFLSDYFYTSSSSRLNWESIDGALLAHSEPCNNQIPALIFNETSFSVVTVPILIQSDYVLVFQVNTQCRGDQDSKCGNQTNSIEYRSESASKWSRLAEMSDLVCRTSLINAGYFNIHTIKLPQQTYSSGTQFRWVGSQAKNEQWSMNSLFIGECPEYCHDRGLCTITGCQCVIGYSGTYCENYIGNESLPISFNETFDDSSSTSINVANLNNWIKLSSDGHIRHVCDEDIHNITSSYLSGQALHFGAGCGCGSVEAITRELNITQATTISFAFHVTMEDNCKLTKNNITVALEWTYDEGISWERLVTMYNRERAQFFNITLPSAMITISKQHRIGGIRFRWTQIQRPSNNTYWAIDNIRLK